MNSSRMNRLEELGRVDAEKAYTKTGKSNLAAEKNRIVRGLKNGGSLKMIPAGKEKSLGQLPTKVRNKIGFMKSGGRVKMKSGGLAKRGKGCEIR
jgi:hypothetical protein|tara:strand:- start:244 stop:528 length:285 start_codon:yes stop_codon:yes gene_type:complete